MSRLSLYFVVLLMLSSQIGKASSILISMDEKQKNHLKAYGITFLALKNGLEADWLLNYRGGSFLIKYVQVIETECKIRGVSYEIITEGEVNRILTQISDPEVNMDMVKLEKAPKMAVYSPKTSPWDDAVKLVLDYAEIPYDIIYDDEVLKGDLSKYDWLHLHHEDFTGEYGLLYQNSYRQVWYIEDVKAQQETASRLGYKKVSQLKLSIAKKIKEFVAGGGFLFAMCSGTDTFDIALAAEGIDICGNIFDGDGIDPDANAKLDFSKTLAFQNFRLDLNPYGNEFSDIDMSRPRVSQSEDFFTLFQFSAKWDVVPAMLTQDHDPVIKSFIGLTTAFRKTMLKPNVLVMGETKAMGDARYIHGEFEKGQWTFYGGHDPEDYQHNSIQEPPTDLNLHPNSPGYRLILNNVLFPAAKKKKQKT